MVGESRIVRVTKGGAKVLRWIQGATSREDERPVLKGVHVAGGVIAAIDGYRMHAAPVPEGLDGCEGQTVAFGNFGSALLVEGHEITGTGPFPDVSYLVKVRPDAPEAVEFYVDAKFLAEALMGMAGTHRGSPARIVFRSKKDAIEVYGKTPEGVSLYALVMPMSVAIDLTWRPFKVEEPPVATSALSTKVNSIVPPTPEE